MTTYAAHKFEFRELIDIPNHVLDVMHRITKVKDRLNGLNKISASSLRNICTI